MFEVFKAIQYVNLQNQSLPAEKDLENFGFLAGIADVCGGV